MSLSGSSFSHSGKWFNSSFAAPTLPAFALAISFWAMASASDLDSARLSAAFNDAQPLRLPPGLPLTPFGHGLPGGLLFCCCS